MYDKGSTRRGINSEKYCASVTEARTQCTIRQIPKGREAFMGLTAQSLFNLFNLRPNMFVLPFLSQEKCWDSHYSALSLQLHGSLRRWVSGCSRRRCVLCVGRARACPKYDDQSKIPWTVQPSRQTSENLARKIGRRSSKHASRRCTNISISFVVNWRAGVQKFPRFRYGHIKWGSNLACADQ